MIPIPQLENKTVLIIDDEQHIRMAVEDILDFYEIKVVKAETGEKGCQLLQEMEPMIGLIILDLSMPHLSGKDTYFRLRQIAKSVPIIISSGYEETEAMKPFEGEDRVTYLAKPYRINSLIEKVRSFLSNSNN